MNDTQLHHYCNRELIEELCKIKDRNVLLLLIDGSSAFGRIGHIDDRVLTIIPAISISGLHFVQLRPSSSLLAAPILVRQLFIDSCNIAHVAEGPFILPPLSFSVDTAAPPSDNTEQVPRTDANTPVPRCQYCNLTEELKELEEQDVGIAALGGWVVGGQIGEIGRCLALISPGIALLPPLIIPGTVTLSGPAFPLGIRLFGTFRVWSNLKALTQVILP